MTSRRFTGLLALAVGIAFVAAAQTRLSATQSPLDTTSLPTGIAPPGGEPIPTGPNQDAVMPPRGDIRPPAPAAGRERHGNPLWAIPLSVLTTARERPLFLPSRRAPAPAVAGPAAAEPVAPAPSPTAAPEKPRLALVGAVVGDREGIAVLLDETTRAIVRLKTGESHAGWTLRSVRQREATLEKDRETMILALPAPVGKKPEAEL